MGKHNKSSSTENDAGARANLDFIFGRGSNTNPSLRDTVPDIHGVIDNTAQKLSDASIIGDDGEDLSDPNTRSESLTEERQTLPPLSNYEFYINQTTYNKIEGNKEPKDIDQVQESVEADGVDGAQELAVADDAGNELPITEVPDEIDLEKLLRNAFEDRFEAEKYASTANGEKVISQPPLPDLSEEKELLESEAVPEIMIDEATLEEQLLLDEGYGEVGRIFSFFTENGINTREFLDVVNSFANNYGKMLGPEEISDLLVIFYRHLVNSLLVKLEKRHKHSCEAAKKYSGILFESQKLNDRKNDKALILSLRIVGKMCDLYEMKKDRINRSLYQDFATEYLSK